MLKLLENERRIKAILIAIILIYSAIGVYVVLHHGQSMFLGSFDRYNNDDVKYIRSGVVLAEKGILTYEDQEKSTVFIMPGLSFVLAALFKVLGLQRGIIAFRLFQVVLQGASLYLLYFIALRSFNSKAALLACLLSTLYIPELFSVNLVLMECIFKFLLMLLCYIGIAAIERKSSKHYMAAGTVWALACYFRPTIALLPIVVLILWFKYKYKITEMLKYGLLTIFIFILLMCPWWIRNYSIYHEFIPFALSSGNPFLQGTYINYDQSRDYVQYNWSRDYVERNQQEKNIGLERLRKFGSKYPIKYIYWYTIGKTIYFWGSPFYWREILGIKLIYVQIYHHVMLVSALLSVFRIRQKNIATDLMLLLIGYFNIIYLPFYTFSRYAYPIMGFVIAFAAQVIAETLNIRKEKGLFYEGKDYISCR